MVAIKFEDVSKRYKLYSKGGLYMRDRLTHALQRLNPFNGVQHSPPGAQPPGGENQNPKSGTIAPLERDFWALKNVSFEIKQGESVGFIGRNGAGKSTILKLLAGVTKPSSGLVEVNGRVAAMIEVGAGFHPELTGRENVYLNGSIMGMTRDEINRDFDSIVEYAELEDFIDTPVKHYSSGMYVRLGFAIAVHTNPDIYLIDEVLAVGDEAFQKKCLDTLEAHKAAGKTMILVSHALEKVEEVCDRCIYMDHGQLRCDDTALRAIRTYRYDVQARNIAQSAAAQESIVGNEVEIVNVIFLDTCGKEIVAIDTGDDLIIEIKYRAQRKIEKPVFGVGFYNDKGTHVTGFNTRTSSVVIDSIEGEGSIFCRLPKVFLSRGIYQISVAIAEYSCRKNYVNHHKAYRLDVHCDQVYTGGVVFSQGEWAQDMKFSKTYGKQTDSNRLKSWA